jgi:hypothetical protein
VNHDSLPASAIERSERRKTKFKSILSPDSVHRFPEPEITFPEADIPGYKKKLERTLKFKYKLSMKTCSPLIEIQKCMQSLSLGRHPRYERGDLQCPKKYRKNRKMCELFCREF